MNQPIQQSAHIEREVRDAIYEHGKCSVLLYPAIANLQAHLDMPTLRDVGMRPKIRAIQPAPLDRASNDDQLLGKIQTALSKILGSEPEFMSVAQAFVATVTQGTLQRVAAIPGIERIRLNGTVRGNV